MTIAAALSEDAAAPRTRVVLRLDATAGLLLRRQCIDESVPAGWHELAIVDLVRGFDGRGLGVARLWTASGKGTNAFITRATWDDMDPLYRGSEPERA